MRQKLVVVSMHETTKRRVVVVMSPPAACSRYYIRALLIQINTTRDPDRDPVSEDQAVVKNKIAHAHYNVKLLNEHTFFPFQFACMLKTFWMIMIILNHDYYIFHRCRLHSSSSSQFEQGISRHRKYPTVRVCFHSKKGM